MVTPEQLEAALQAWRDAVGTGTVARMLAVLEAAEKAAWRPISEHKRDEDSGDYLFTGGTLLCASVEKGYFSKCNWEWMTRDFMICDDDEIRRPAYFRPLPTPPEVP